MDPVEPEVVETEYTPTPEDLTPEEVAPGPDEVIEESPLVGEEPPVEGVVEQDTEPAPVDDTPLYEEVAGDLGLGLEEPSTPDLYTVESEPTEETWATVPEAPLQEIETPENEDEEAASTPEESFLVEEFQGAEDATQALLEYELEGRDAPEASWRPLARVPADQLEAEVLGLPAGEEWEVRVRGHLADGTATDWSAPAPVTLPVDMVPPDLPSAPLVTGGFAGVTVKWDGRAASGRAMPADFARLIIWHSLSGVAGTWVRKHSLFGPDEVLITDLKAGQPHYFAFTAVDETGNESGLSAIASAEMEILVDTADLEATLATARAELDEVRAALEARRGTVPPTGPDTEGRVYYQVDDTNTPVAVWRYTDGRWVPVPLEDAVFVRVSTDQLVAGMALIGGALIKNGAITADHITASESMSAKLGQFLKVTAGMIQSNAFEGQTFTGGAFTGALFQTVSTPLRGVKMSSTGLRAWDDAGKLTANIDGKNNLLSGVLRTSPEGEAGLIIDPQNASSRRPVLFFSPDGSTASSTAAIYTSPDWDLILRGRSLPGGRARVIVLGGIEAREGGMLVSDGYGVASNGKGVFNGLEVAVGTSDFFSAASFKDRSDHQGRMTLTSGDATASAANMHIDQYGVIRKSTSAARFKADQRDAEVPDALLDLPVKTWIDRRSQQVMDDLDGVMGPLTRTDAEDLDAARQAVARRGFGVIAEDVEKVDPRLATYDADGRVEGVAYDRFGPALIPIVRRQRDRIAELEKQVEALTSRLDAAGL